MDAVNKARGTRRSPRGGTSGPRVIGGGHARRWLAGRAALIFLGRRARSCRKSQVPRTQKSGVPPMGHTRIDRPEQQQQHDGDDDDEDRSDRIRSGEIDRSDRLGPGRACPGRACVRACAGAAVQGLVLIQAKERAASHRHAGPPQQGQGLSFHFRACCWPVDVA